MFLGFRSFLHSLGGSSVPQLFWIHQFFGSNIIALPSHEILVDRFPCHNPKLASIPAIYIYIYMYVCICIYI